MNQWFDSRFVRTHRRSDKSSKVTSYVPILNVKVKARLLYVYDWHGRYITGGNTAALSCYTS